MQSLERGAGCEPRSERGVVFPVRPNEAAERFFRREEPPHVAKLGAARDAVALEAFQKTRNAPGALYSVAGKDGGALAWDKKT